nr:acyltransferase [uncultured Rhodopila sp.]
MKRLECLDGLRGMLAVYVLLGHMAPFAMLPDVVQSLVSHGGAAVDLFFVLSGLVIVKALDRANRRADAFLIARAARIFPVFLPVFAVSVALQAWSCGLSDMPWIGPDNAAQSICVTAWPRTWLPEILAHLTMTHGLFPKAVLPDVWVSFLGATWSLSTEWQFYVLALLLHAAGPRRLVGVLLGLAVAGAAWRLSAPELWQFSRAFLPNKAHFFALGVASLPVVRSEAGGWRQYWAVLAAAVAVCATQGAFGRLLPPVVWTLCLAVQMRPRAFGLGLAGTLLRSRIAAYLGAISYCVYLVNEPIHKVLSGALSGVADGDAVLFTLMWVPASILLPIGVSAWLHQRVEVPALRWGRSAAARQGARPDRHGHGWRERPAPASSCPVLLQRRCEDGRDTPGHDDQAQTVGCADSQRDNRQG